MNADVLRSIIIMSLYCEAYNMAHAAARPGYKIAFPSSLRIAATTVHITIVLFEWNQAWVDVNTF